MGRRIEKTMQAVVEARLCTKGGTVFFEGQDRNAGLEVHGNLKRLLSVL